MIKKITTQYMGLNLTLDGLARVNYIVGVNGAGKTRFFESLKQRTALYIDQSEGEKLDLYIPVNFYVTDEDEFCISRDGSLANHRFDLDLYMVKGERRVPTPLGDSFPTHPLTTKIIEFFYPGSNFELKMRGDNFVEFWDKNYPEKGWRKLIDLSGGFQSLFKLWALTYHGKYPKGRGLYLIGFDEGDRHLHPSLAKKLPSILDELIVGVEQDMQGNSNGHAGAKVQIFVATHSPFTVRGALEQDDHKIFHIENGALKNSFDRNELIKKSGMPFDDVLADLGFKMQDLYDPDALICVEGPVDAMYLSYWLEKYLEENGLPKDTFIKGVHYDFYEFGGALAAHLTAQFNGGDDCNDPLIPQGIVNLFSLNRRIFLMVDNDSGDAFEKSKRRLKALIDKHPSCVFYRSENYKTIECLLSESTEYSKNKSSKVEAAVTNLRHWRGASKGLIDFNPEVYPLMNAVYNFLKFNN